MRQLLLIKVNLLTKGTGRFGPFVKYKDLYVNVPKKYDFDNLSQGDIEELIFCQN